MHCKPPQSVQRRFCLLSSTCCRHNDQCATHVTLQVSRILGNYCVGAIGPELALPIGAAAGLLGYGSMAAASTLYPAAVGPGALAACLLLVGLSEVITALQSFCKKTYAADPVVLRSNLLRLVSAVNTAFVQLCAGVPAASSAVGVYVMHGN